MGFWSSGFEKKLKMATITKFEDLRIWQESRKVCQMILVFIRKPEFSKDFSLKDQIRRSSGSCMDNIAEGFSREGNKEFKNFLSIAKGSIEETRSQLYRALDSGYISQFEFETCNNCCDKLSRQINSFMRYLKDSDYKGNKFSEPQEDYGVKDS